MESKHCTKCGLLRELDEFPKEKRASDGRGSICKKCSAEYTNEWKRKHPERVSEYGKKERLEKPEQSRARTQRWRNNNREKMRELSKAWSEKFPERRRAQVRKWREENHEKYLELVHKYQRNNKDTVRETRRKVYQKRKSTPMGALTGRMSSAIGHALRGNKNGRPWEKLVGYSANDLKVHLESRFLPGMSWDNRDQWQIDHIIPISAFNYETPDDLDFKRCWALDNLRPLWSIENWSKNNRLTEPFQPSLAMGV